MSTTLKIYDPLKAVKRMQKAGVQKDLAESIAEEIRESQDCIINDLATKHDLISEIALVRADIEVTKKDLIIKLGSFIIFTGLSVSAFLAWFLPIAISNALQ